MAVTRARARRVARAVTGAGFVACGAGLAGCNECAGVRPCEGTPTVSATIRFVTYDGNRPVGGVRVALVRTGGVGIHPDSVEGRTGADGFVTLRAAAERVDALTADLVVTPPDPWTPYRVSGYPLYATQGRGDGAIIGRWVVDPFVEYVGELHDAATDGRIVGARATFVRRSGARLRPDTLTDVTEDGGRFFWRARAADAGVAVGDLYVDGPMFGATRVVRDVVVPVTVDDRPVQVNGVFAVPLGGVARGR